jgi:hypothetical protein
MKRYVWVALPILLAAAPLWAESGAPLSGGWKLDRSRSEPQGSAAANAKDVFLVIKQTPDQVVLERWVGRQGALSLVGSSVVSADGAVAQTSGGASVPSNLKAQWRGTQLVLEGSMSVKDQKAKTKEVISLLPPDMLKVEKVIETPDVTFKTVEVFVRAEP